MRLIGNVTKSSKQNEMQHVLFGNSGQLAGTYELQTNKQSIEECKELGEKKERAGSGACGRARIFRRQISSPPWFIVGEWTAPASAPRRIPPANSPVIMKRACASKVRKLRNACAVKHRLHATAFCAGTSNYRLRETVVVVVVVPSRFFFVFFFQWVGFFSRRSCPSRRAGFWIEGRKCGWRRGWAYVKLVTQCRIDISVKVWRAPLSWRCLNILGIPLKASRRCLVNISDVDTYYTLFLTISYF